MPQITSKIYNSLREIKVNFHLNVHSFHTRQNNINLMSATLLLKFSTILSRNYNSKSSFGRKSITAEIYCK